MTLAFLWSKPFLTSRFMLWSLLWINAAGTVYGYMWYWEQLKVTAAEKPFWMVLLVPDSPTASLFFTLSLLYLLTDRGVDRLRVQSSAIAGGLRSLIETIGVVTSFKYGIWAVWMILDGYVQGDAFAWQDGMLAVSHLGMAVEALLFARFFRIKPVYLYIAAIWVLGNDYVDYHFGVYPWLPDQLEDDLASIRVGTMLLSVVSILLFAPLARRRS